ncbi:MAG: hypothetical protein GXO63_02910 [Candidatus Micrarchaeota archaeon]|nr:hypothetical protein [Candidatus Micrarchaeota archaeon]
MTDKLTVYLGGLGGATIAYKLGASLDPKLHGVAMFLGMVGGMFGAYLIDRFLEKLD